MRFGSESWPEGSVPVHFMEVMLMLKWIFDGTEEYQEQVVDLLVTLLCAPETLIPATNTTCVVISFQACLF